MILAASLAVFYGLVRYRFSQKARLESQIPEVSAVNVRVIKATEETIREHVSFVGNIEAIETVPVYPKLSNLTVTNVNVYVGDRVKKGQILATLDDSLMTTNLQQAKQVVGAAEANFRQSESTSDTRRKDYERYKSLVDEGVISRQEFDQAENQFRVAQEQALSARHLLAEARAALSNARISMGYHNVVAPVGGIISERNVDPGDKSNSDNVMFVLSRQDGLKLTGMVSESAFMTLKTGAPATVTAEALPGQAFEASVTRVYPTVDASTRSGRVELGIDSGGALKPGLYAQGEIEIGRHVGKVLPREAIRPLNGTPDWRVFLISGDHGVEARSVKLGMDRGNRVEILEGISLEDKIIVTQSDRLNERGVRVKVVDR
jgi:RND family efflux transporter MFP subunit